jgi:cytochrome P450
LLSSISTPSVSDLDLFSDENLRDPYPAYERLRQAGPAVFMERYGFWALPRYAEVWQVQRHPERFTSVGGPGLNVQPDPMFSGFILSTDPPEHTRYRKLVNEMLGAKPLAAVQEEIEERAERLVSELVQAGSFDAVTDLAARFSIDVVGDLVRLPAERGDLLAMADVAFNLFGPLNERSLAGMPMLMKMFEYLQGPAAREHLTPGSWGETVWQAVDQGRISADEGLSSMTGFIVAGMDTTTNGIGSAVLLLASNPDQWDALRSDPSLAKGAFEEALRLESPVQSFFRGVTEAIALEGVSLAAGDRVMMLLGSANRDERKWTDPERFDISRSTVGHMAYGGGTHRCGGAALAQIEGTAILSALARCAEKLELAGEPTWRINNVVRGLASLPVSVA